MCGICGFTGDEDKNLINAMCNIISHRGPDDSGIFTDKNISLGHRRLSIIDLEGGHQPIHNEDETIWVVYNGELYNFRELKKELEHLGHKFYTNCDTEIIVHAYEEYGIKCIEKFRGMFAFALWDSNKKKLVLARDRLGIKPLYYAITGESIVFASEIKAILLNKNIPKKIDYCSLNNFIALRYIPGDRTIFEGIKKLMPSNILTFENKEITLKKYWELSFNPEERTEDYFSEKLLRILTKSVEMRLMSEVPIGAYLSGGLDSSSVVAIMSKLMSEPVKTFSVGFGVKEFDELESAKVISEHFGTDHHEIIVEPDMIDTLPKIIWHFDEPVADPAAIPTFLLSETAKKYVTVVLTGEGGDELFGGYEHYKIMSLTDKYYSKIPFANKLFPKIPFIVKKIPKSILNKFFKYSSSLGEEGMRRFSEYIYSFDDKAESYLKSYLNIVSIFDKDERIKLYSENFKLDFDVDITKNFEKYFKLNNVINNLIFIELNTALPENLLMKVDKMTMAHSIEARVPLLDHILVEFSATIPPQMKLKGQQEKYILRKAMSGILPKSTINKKKERFFVPIHLWKDELTYIIDSLLSESFVKRQGCFRYEHIQKIINALKSNESSLYYSRQIWNLINFELWYKIYIENDISDPKLSIDKLI